MSQQAALPLVAVSAPVYVPRTKPTDPRRDLSAALESRLRRGARGGGPVALGTIEEPYLPARAMGGEARGEEEPSPLAPLLGFEGLQVTVTTRSPEILGDLDLLVDLDRRHAVTVDVMLAALDPFLVRRLEPQAAGARDRLRAVARLAAEGIAVRILCTPLRSGLNDGESALRPLFAAAREAGAQDVLAATAPERSARLARLRGVFGSLGAVKAFRDHGAPDTADLDRRRALFRRLRLEHGFPRSLPGRG